MATNKNRTLMLTKEQATATKNWIQVNAEGKTLGILAAEIAKILRGKHKVTFTPNIDCGDGVIVINASKVKVSGSKEAQKMYRHYTGFIGGMRATPYRVMMDRNPTFILRHAVQGMIPKTRLGKAQLKRLRIFPKEEHNLPAQKPIQVAM